ncbi:hypothetical protein RFEPED_1451 [Rickettsia felis str. Pedreira]|uniref:Uncharacterized protein n=1 Tax=Rickettsia felis str. Pedreira TaxID=1359196 RepID=A0A0F3MWZ3_RICFI|nr:hypothetical protein [Rickettsia felis]KJV59054.1 hypothetical protein RFEPED_1451 [Rickettsia felis str. Pedreira]
MFENSTSLRGKTASFDEAISGVCYYFTRLPRSLRSLAMTIKIILLIPLSFD